MMTTRAALAAAVMLYAVPASADPVCLKGEATEMLNLWIEKTEQAPLVRGEISTGEGGTMSMILTVGQDGKFTILFRNPQGVTCILAVGEHLRPGGATEKVLPPSAPAAPLRPEKGEGA